ncbi:hypothetical protein BCV00_12220 [Vibrio breoganii]|nr:hypothetical protein BCV00_12220 [Vibrio breoganii]
MAKWSLFKRFVVPKAGVVIEENCAFEKGNRLWSMGAFSYSRSCLITHGNLTVGRYTSIADNVSFMGANHPIARYTSSPITYDAGFLGLKSKNVKPTAKQGDTSIGHDVWIGSNVLLKPGINIGDGAVIAANSVVVKDVDPYTIVGGVPAKKIKLRFPEEQIAALQVLKWWEYDYRDFDGLDITASIDVFIQWFSETKAKGELSKYKPKQFRN